ncbi:MAG TPA: tetratricopeptide repeat protein, partial [Thermodesulfovibrionales bacterium]|nr:tetratricopeptide repeat protein [Thermodesulfovibrionales bacterium]
MPDKNLIVKEAQKYLARGQLDKAIAEWEKLVKEAPDGNIYNTVGDLHLKKGNKRTAVDYFHKAATYFREGGFSLKALALYKKVINIDPADAGAYTALGELSEEKGLVTDAIKYYLTVADIISREGGKERFLSIYERILSLAPSNIPLRDKVAGLFLKEGLIPDAAEEYLHIATFCVDKGDLEQAKAYFVKILEIQPNNGNAMAGLSHLCEKRGDLQQSLLYAKKALDLQGDDLHLLLRCAFLQKEVAAYDEALACATRAAELAPSDTKVNRLIGDIHFAKGDREMAWESYKTVVDALVRESRIDEGIALAKQFKDVSPVEIGTILISLYGQKDDREALFDETLFVADLLMDSGMEGEAIGHYRAALSIHPDDIQIKKILAEHEMAVGMEPSSSEGGKSAEDLLTDADIFIKYGLYDEARAILEDLKLSAPDNTDVHAKLCSLFLGMNDREQAVTECLILYELYGRSGQTEMRESALMQASEISPDDPRVLERVSARDEARVAAPRYAEAGQGSLEDYVEDIAEAEFYMRQGLKEDALRIYHKLLNLFPGNSELLGKVASLEGSVPEPVAASGEMSIDDGKELDESGPFETIEAHELQEEVVEPQFDTDVLDIFEEFKKGLEKELEAEDSETHYNLGIAYKEMGLIDDAIKEFQTARNDPKCSVRAMSMLGIC